MLAAVSGGPRGDVALWDVADPWRPVHIGDVTMPASFGPVAGVDALSPNGQLLAVGNAAARIQLVSLADLRSPPAHRATALGRHARARAAGSQPGRHRPGQRRQLRAGPSVGRERPRSALVPSRRSRRQGYLLGVAFSPNGRLSRRGEHRRQGMAVGHLPPSAPKAAGRAGRLRQLRRMRDVHAGRPHAHRRQRRRHGPAVGHSRPRPPHGSWAAR